jgi:hypothetical protein
VSDFGNSNNLNGSSYGWRWKPVDLVVLAVAFLVWWPLGIAVLAWKLWNDRQAVPQDLGQWIQTGATKVQQSVETLFTGFGATAAAGPEVTGNAAFDAHVREEWARIETDRRRLQDEIAAFRSFLASERSGDRDAYERFRRTRGG